MGIPTTFKTVTSYNMHTIPEITKGWVQAAAQLKEKVETEEEKGRLVQCAKVCSDIGGLAFQRQGAPYSDTRVDFYVCQDEASVAQGLMMTLWKHQVLQVTHLVTNPENSVSEIGVSLLQHAEKSASSVVKEIRVPKSPDVVLPISAEELKELGYQEKGESYSKNRS